MLETRMKRLIGLILLLAAIPICGYLSGMFVTSQLEGQWVDAVERYNDHSNAAAARAIAPTALRSYCDSPDQRDDEACAAYTNAGWLRTASIAVLIAGFALLAAIYAAAKFASRDRNLLLKTFAPGMKAVLIVLFALILAQGAIATYGAYSFEAAAVHRVHLFLIGGIGLGALLGACSMLEAGFSISRRVEHAVLGKAITREQEPGIWALVEDIAQRLGSVPPKNIVVGLEPNFYVTAADVVVNPARIEKRDETLYLSLPLMRTLSGAELSAVIGHELGHFKGEDTRFSLDFYPIYAGTAQALEVLRREGHAGPRGLALLPALAILSFFMEQFANAERAIGRERELQADQAGASVASPAALSTALLKIGAFAPLWDSTVVTMVDELRQGHPFTNISGHYAQVAAASAKPELLDDVAAAATAHPIDTHPPTAARIEALGLSVEQLRDFALSVDHQTSSVQLLADPVALEEELTAAAHRVLAERGAVPAPLPGAPERSPASAEAQHIEKSQLEV
jgi:Zn-dependent protease with chaperone function